MRYTTTVSYTHLDVYERQVKCRQVKALLEKIIDKKVDNLKVLLLGR